jgi:hypothetical protein
MALQLTQLTRPSMYRGFNSEVQSKILGLKEG